LTTGIAAATERIPRPTRYARSRFFGGLRFTPTAVD
jgi:hypothetical protein